MMTLCLKGGLALSVAFCFALLAIPESGWGIEGSSCEVPDVYQEMTGVQAEPTMPAEVPGMEESNQALVDCKNDLEGASGVLLSDSEIDAQVDATGETGTAASGSGETWIKIPEPITIPAPPDPEPTFSEIWEIFMENMIQWMKENYEEMMGVPEHYHPTMFIDLNGDGIIDGVCTDGDGTIEHYIDEETNPFGDGLSPIPIFPIPRC